jgi:steroid 5-alpha reductase family enzyme
MAILKPIIGILLILLVSAGIVVAGNQGSIVTGGVPLFMLCASTAFILHWLVFIPSTIFQTEHYFDLTGSLSYIAAIIIAVTHHPQLDTRGQLLCLLIGVWALRLGLFLFLRVKKAGQDRRFVELKTRFFRFLFTWTLGAGWVFITMAAGFAAITSATQLPADSFMLIGFGLWLIGFAVEVIADRQKTRFRAIPANAEKFISSGLWAYSRHPNYFGEIVLWLGIAFIAFPVLSGWQLITLISPLFVTFLLLKVSGVKLLEESGQKRWGTDPEYQQYLARTPVLVPFIGSSK